MTNAHLVPKMDPYKKRPKSPAHTLWCIFRAKIHIQELEAGTESPGWLTKEQVIEYTKRNMAQWTEQLRQAGYDIDTILAGHQYTYAELIARSPFRR